jgi:hypothetical protein
MLGARPGVSRVRIPKGIVICSIVAATTFFLVRHVRLEWLTGGRLFSILVDKWRLGILRWFNFAVLGLLLLKFRRYLAQPKLVAMLAPLGRSSLEVFSAHLLFCLIALGLVVGPKSHVGGWWQDILIAAGTVAGLFAVAAWAERRRRVGFRSRSGI